MNRKYPTFKTNRLRRNISPSRRIQSRKFDQYGKTQSSNGSYMLKKNNRALAAELNAYKLQTKALTEKINALNEENMDLRVELAEIKQNVQLSSKSGYKGKHSIGTHRKSSCNLSNLSFEDEFHKKMAKFLEPLKACLHQSLNHTVRLSDSLSQSLELATVPGIRAKSLSSIESSPAELELTREGVPQTYETRKNRERNNLSLPIAPFTAKSSKNRLSGHSGATAKVIPMVKGHMVDTQPKLKIARLNMNDLAEIDDNLSVRRSDDNIMHADSVNNSINIDNVEGVSEYQEAAEVLHPEENIMFANGASNNRRQGNTGTTNPVLTISGMRSRRQKKRKYSIRRSHILHEEDEETLEENETINNQAGTGISMEVNGVHRQNETVVLLPRIVLDRVTITSPSKQNNIKSNADAKRKLSKRRSSIINTITPQNENVSPSSPPTSYQKRFSGSISNKRRSKLSNRYTASDLPTDANIEQTAKVVVPSLSLSPSVLLERCEIKSSPRRNEDRQISNAREKLTPNVITRDKCPTGNSIKQHLISETPTTRNSFEEFQKEMFDMNPLEGPSWLFSDSDDTPSKNSKARDNDQSLNGENMAKSPKEEKKLGSKNVLLDETVSKAKEAKKWNNKKERSDAMSMKARLSGRLSKRLSDNFASSDDTLMESSTKTVNPSEHADNSLKGDSKLQTDLEINEKFPSPETTGSLDSDMTSQSDQSNTKLRATRSEGMEVVECKNFIQSTSNNEPENDNLSRPRRRAASVAVGSLKEQPIGKKLRQGDPNTSSVYTSAVARDEGSGANTESNTKTQRKSSVGKNQNKKTKKL